MFNKEYLKSLIAVEDMEYYVITFDNVSLQQVVSVLQKFLIFHNT